MEEGGSSRKERVHGLAVWLLLEGIDEQWSLAQFKAENVNQRTSWMSPSKKLNCNPNGTQIQFLMCPSSMISPRNTGGNTEPKERAAVRAAAVVVAPDFHCICVK